MKRSETVPFIPSPLLTFRHCIAFMTSPTQTEWSRRASERSRLLIGSSFFFLIQGHLIWQTWKSDDIYWPKLQQYLYHWHIHQRNLQFFYWLYWSFSTQSTMVWHRTLNQLLLEPLNSRSSATNQYYFFGLQSVKHVPIVENCGGMEKNVTFLTVQLHTHVSINVGAYG